MASVTAVLVGNTEDRRVTRHVLHTVDGDFTTTTDLGIYTAVRNHTHTRASFPDCWRGRAVVMATIRGKVDAWRLADEFDVAERYAAEAADVAQLAGEHSDRAAYVTHMVTVWLENDGLHADIARKVREVGDLSGLRAYVLHVLDAAPRESAAAGCADDLSKVDRESRVRWADVAHSLALD